MIWYNSKLENLYEGVDIVKPIAEELDSIDSSLSNLIFSRRFNLFMHTVDVLSYLYYHGQVESSY
jgi:hypothetical protein